LSPAAVRNLRVVARAPVTAEDLAALQTDVLTGYVFAQAAARTGKARQEAGRTGKPRKPSLTCFSLGANARTQADNCILDYCNWLGDIAKRIAASAAISIDIVKGYATAFESAGSDEFIFIRATASPDQLELLAGAVL
jgi:hypothetical protein